MNRIILFLSFLFVFFLQSCVEKTGYYDPDQESVVERFTEKEWERTFESPTMDGVDCTIHEVWKFGNDGKCVCKSFKSYENGETEENVRYDRWAFITPDFGFLCFGSTTFWEIEKLTDTELHVIESFEDPLTVPGQDRTYIKYTHKEDKEPAN
ncbi:hypothetical protein, secreted [gut metagenome]|uniref:Lipocalin-like domain-containing protein n=1 Tax=gut metagenome TaxID=749906 RepID=J9CWL4_9ZZZZ